MLVQIANKNGLIIDQFLSEESKNIAANKAIDLAYNKSISVFAIYIDGVLDCYSECLKGLDLPKVI